MSKTLKTLGIGLYWDQLKEGDRFRTLNRTITEPDIVNFIGVTGMVETLLLICLSQRTMVL